MRQLMSWRWLPLIVFVTLVIVLYQGLWLNPWLLPSTRIGKPAPAINGLPLLDERENPHMLRKLQGHVWLMNVWATWCQSCESEHAVLNNMAEHGVMIVGLAYKDSPLAVRRYLALLGNPFVQVRLDGQGIVAEQWGVYGAPETFLIDADGIVRYKHIGELTSLEWRQHLQPLIHRLTAHVD